MNSPLIDQLTAALGPGYTIERELGGGGMSRVFVALEESLERRVAVKVLPDYLAAAVSVDRFKREILLSAGLQHPHIVGVLSAGEAGGLPFFVMPYVEGESLGTRLARTGPLPIRLTVSILKDVARALSYAHERGVVHRDIKPHNILLAAGAATVTDFGVAKALSSARRSGGGAQGLALTDAGTSLGTPLYMAPEQAAADPDIDHRADIYALGVTAYEMLTGSPPFAGMPPRALLTARMTQDPPRVESLRPDVPLALAALVMRCLAREPEDRPQTAEEVLVALDDPAMVSGAFVAPERRRVGWHLVRDWRIAALAASIIALAGVGGSTMARFRDVAVTPAKTAAQPIGPSPASLVVLPLVSIGADSGNAYLAAGITNELASALSRVPGVRVVSPSRAATMLASGKSPSDIGKALNVAQQLEGTVQRDGKRLRVTARLVGVNDGVMHWSDMYERDATDILTVQQELARVITGAVGDVMGRDIAEAAIAIDSTPTVAEGAAYDLYLRGRFQLGRRGAGALRQAITYFERAIKKDPGLAPAYSGLADAQGLLPLYTNVPAEPALMSALKNADRAITLDSSLAEAWASRGVLLVRSYRWAEAERDFRRAIALKPTYAPAHQWLGELLVVVGRVPDAMRALERAAQLEPASPVIVGSLSLALGLAGRTNESIATAERAVSYDSTLLVTRFMLGAVRLYARQPAAAVAPLEAAVHIEPESFTVLGLLGYAYAASGNVDAARRMRARIESIPQTSGAQVALARISLGTGDTADALNRLEKAAKAHDVFFSTESATSPIFDALRTSPRYAALLRSIGLTPPRIVASR